MKIVVIGAVAAGTSAAAKARRNDERAQITIYEKDSNISYSGCGMPYFISGEIKAVNELTPREPEFFKKKYNIDIKIKCEVIDVDTKERILTVKNISTGEVFTDNYDKLVLATGATPFKPNIDGVDAENVFFLRNIADSIKIKQYINAKKPRTAVIGGTGFIGLEMLESLTELGIQTQIVELAPHITPNLDKDIAKVLENRLVAKGVNVFTGTSISKILNGKVELSNGKEISADIVLMATGVRPNTQLAKHMGVEIGTSGAIKVDSEMNTNIQDISACGDCIETFCTVTGEKVYRPLGSTANKTGRIAGQNISGKKMQYKGNLGTGIFKVFDITVASTGLTEERARKHGFDAQVCHNIKPDKPHYMGGKEMTIKAVADRKTGRLLGVQIVGFGGVDKRIDIFATLITYKATVDELFDLDLAYAPPFSTAKDAVHYTGMILDNAINNDKLLVTAENLASLGDNVQLLDTRTNGDVESKGTIKGAKNIPHAKLRDEMAGLNKKAPVVTFCNKGVTGNAAQNILHCNGFESVYNLSGGHKFYLESK